MLKLHHWTRQQRIIVLLLGMFAGAILASVGALVFGPPFPVFTEAFFAFCLCGLFCLGAAIGEFYDRPFQGGAAALLITSVVHVMLELGSRFVGVF